jgi:hypothetical protein
MKSTNKVKDSKMKSGFYLCCYGELIVFLRPLAFEEGQDTYVIEHGEDGGFELAYLSVESVRFLLKHLTYLGF